MTNPTETAITVWYSSVDSYGRRTRRVFKTLAGARRFAHEWIGEFPSLGQGYAISDDGIGKIEVRGCSLRDLFPARGTEA